MQICYPRIYNFIILTSNNQQYLYCLKDFSSSHHIREFLTFEIKSIIDKISAEKFNAIITDNITNVQLVCKLVIRKYSQILNFCYIMHFINLIIKSILGNK